MVPDIILLLNLKLFHFLLRFFKHVENTGFEIILLFKIEFIVDFDSPVIPFLYREEISGLIRCLQALLLLQEHSCNVLGCSQHELLESSLSFQ
jgi:hypothetical protein